MAFKDVVEKIGIDELAQKAGVHPNSIRNYMNKRREPSVTTAFRLEKATAKKITARELAKEFEEHGK